MLWEEVRLDANYGAVLMMLGESGVLLRTHLSGAGGSCPITIACADRHASRPWSSLSLEREMRLACRLRRAPGIAERLVAACYGLGHYHQFWRRGALMRARSVIDGGLLIELRSAADGTTQWPPPPRAAALSRSPIPRRTRGDRHTRRRARRAGRNPNPTLDPGPDPNQGGVTEIELGEVVDTSAFDTYWRRHQSGGGLDDGARDTAAGYGSHGAPRPAHTLLVQIRGPMEAEEELIELLVQVQLRADQSRSAWPWPYFPSTSPHQVKLRADRILCDFPGLADVVGEVRGTDGSGLRLAERSARGEPQMADSGVQHPPPSRLCQIWARFTAAARPTMQRCTPPSTWGSSASVGQSKRHKSCVLPDEEQPACSSCWRRAIAREVAKAALVRKDALGWTDAGWRYIASSRGGETAARRHAGGHPRCWAPQCASPTL